VAAIAVRDRPYCPDSLAPDVKRHQQALFHRGRYRDEVWVTPLEVSEQQCTVLIEHVSAGTEIARRPAANMPFPFASNGWPIKPFPPSSFVNKLRPEESHWVTSRIVSASV